MSAIPSEVQKLGGLAARLFASLQKLTRDREPHACGGFTTDDMQWCMGTAFLSQKSLDEGIELLSQLGVIRYAGYDEDDGIGHCYEILNREGRS